MAEEKNKEKVKVDQDGFIDMTKVVAVKPCPLLEAEMAMASHFLETSQERGKAISILLPLVDQEDITELLAELYDRRADDKFIIPTMDLINKELNGIKSLVDQLRKSDSLIKIKEDIKCPKKKTPQKAPATSPTSSKAPAQKKQ